MYYNKRFPDICCLFSILPLVFLKEEEGRIHMCLSLWKNMLWLMVNKEWQLEFKILSLLLIKLISKTQLRNVSTVGFPILNPVCPPELAPYKPPHEANPEYFPRWSCRVKSLLLELSLLTKGKRRKDWAPYTIFSPKLISHVTHSILREEERNRAKA